MNDVITVDDLDLSTLDRNVRKMAFLTANSILIAGFYKSIKNEELAIKNTISFANNVCKNRGKGNSQSQCGDTPCTLNCMSEADIKETLLKAEVRIKTKAKD